MGKAVAINMRTKTCVPATPAPGTESHSALNTHKYLSPFQVVKFSYMFDAFFDIEKSGLLEEDDLDAFFNKIIKYLGVEPNSKRYFRFQDVKNSFWECIKDQLVREYKADDDGDAMIGWAEAFAKAREVDTSKMTLTQWLNMWDASATGRPASPTSQSGSSSSPQSSLTSWTKVVTELFTSPTCARSTSTLSAFPPMRSTRSRPMDTHK